MVGMETKYLPILTRALLTNRSSQAMNLLVQSGFLPFYVHALLDL